jgi:hypothetical protein
MQTSLPRLMHQVMAEQGEDLSPLQAGAPKDRMINYIENSI